MWTFISILGVALGVSLYAMLMMGRIRSDTSLYLLGNVAAAILVSFSLIDHYNPATAILQSFYGSASLYGWLRLR